MTFVIIVSFIIYNKTEINEIDMKIAKTGTQLIFLLTDI